MAERHYQASLIKRLKREFQGSMILKNDSSYIQGVPDLILLYGPYWAMLEVKADKDSPFQVNQEYYIGLLDEMSFAACIYPENEDEVIRAIQQAFGLRGKTCAPERKQASLAELHRPEDRGVRHKQHGGRPRNKTSRVRG